MGTQALPILRGYVLIQKSPEDTRGIALRRGFALALAMPGGLYAKQHTIRPWADFGEKCHH
jgi:hypothetical protein